MKEPRAYKRAQPNRLLSVESPIGKPLIQMNPEEARLFTLQPKNLDFPPRTTVSRHVQLLSSGPDFLFRPIREW
ncbi:unnamed protein product, partial [Dovyalis caffra]